MSLSFDELAWVLEETVPVVLGAHIRELHDDGGDSCFVTLRIAGRNLVLQLCAAPRLTRLLIVPRRPVTQSSPLAFTMALRKQLEGRVVTGLTLADDDRVVSMSTAAGREEPGFELIAELTGSSGNLVLVDPDGRVHTTLRPGPRLRPGERYQPPPRPESRRVAAAPPVRWGDLRADTQALARSAAIDATYQALSLEQAVALRRQRLTRGITTALRKAARREAALEGDLRRASEAQQLRRWADLLSAHYGRVERGAESVVLEDYFDEARPVRVPLLPALTVRANIERYYRQYKRMHNAAGDIEDRRAEAAARVHELDALLAAVAAASDLQTLERQASTASSLGVVVAPVATTRAASRSRRPASRPALPYRAFVSASGLTIWVGRSARDNDALTFRYASGHDLWLHASGYAGSHVIVRLARGQDPDSQTLVDAATLAAHYSRGRRGTLVEVLYTRQKHVRRIKGAPGKVTAAGAKTIAVRLEADRLARLFETTQAAAP